MSTEDGSRQITRLTVPPEQAGTRLDKTLSTLLPDMSRSRLQSLIKEGHVHINGSNRIGNSMSVSAGDIIEINIPPPADPIPQPEAIPLEIIYEDSDLIVINKQAGLVVHPGAGNMSGTLVNALLYHCKGALSGIGGVARPGIVHRLDKDTSGLMVAAKTDRAHQGLAAQLEDRSLGRIYEALVLKVPVPPKGTIDRSIGRDPHNRLKMAAGVRGGKEARTHYTVMDSYEDGAASRVECVLESGRTHQIRVHMAMIKHPLIGDPLYGPQPTALRAALNKAGYEKDDIEFVMSFPRQALHARELHFNHPVTGESLQFSAPPPEDFSTLLKLLDDTSRQ
ncbi:MAG: RluA family pseudouridine synthase [Alphaproteobacteria bacterium]|nr:RluA family pseudouridine synthase [Alphaproteobacteria bacterium]